ncbi:AIR synthase family protein [Halococcus saccharolyticus]|uniref:AIR synthase related protein domain protein n=1 Tax=Halococcus saccharolyticus DSM 5350 TaxID=1227455 RepID=M0MG82_9EURY|nr:AIR synthase family protein [Halococcus saccharolyticus]EMA44737.1 AIR synthase related protein domain protein [Halococcus saccharolyticus DSM 5350]
MADYGKVDAGFFDEHIYPRLGADRADVALGPQHGVDFGVVEIADQGVVVATDPISVLPELGYERAGRFALDVVLADVAVSGLPPSFLSINFSLPPEMTDEEFATLWAAIDREATALGTSVIAGHTARYEGCSFPWVGGATALAVGDSKEIVRPDGARPGDRLVLTTGPAVEAVGLLTTLFGDRMDLPERTLEIARERLDDTDTVRDALVAAAAGPVTAMHDVTEGGLANALCEVATSAGVRLDIDREAVPMRPGVEPICEYLDIDPWTATSSGSLLIAVAPEGLDNVLAALDERETTAAVIGTVAEGDGAYVEGERIEGPIVDSSWGVYADYAAGENES